MWAALFILIIHVVLIPVHALETLEIIDKLLGQGWPSEVPQGYDPFNKTAPQRSTDAVLSHYIC